jgi:hypothetical protein
MFQAFAELATSLRPVATWTDVVYMPPEPEDAFRRWIGVVAEAFPVSPVYGGIRPGVHAQLSAADAIEGDDQQIHRCASACMNPGPSELAPTHCGCSGIGLAAGCPRSHSRLVG